MTKELFRQQAIEWQKDWGTESLKDFLAEYAYFDKYADEYDLREEFIENGILEE